jgi:hypothetical protein
VTEDPVVYGKSIGQQAPARIVLLCGLALVLGVVGDLSSCERIPAALWIPLLTGCYYVAIVVAAVTFGYRSGAAAAVVAGAVHITVGLIVCGRSIQEQGEVVTFITVGLLAGLVARHASKNIESSFAQPGMAAPGQHYLGNKSPQEDVLSGGQISPGFIQAFRAPLAAIESAGHLLGETELKSEIHREVAAIILQECHRLDVLAWSLETARPRLPFYREVRLSSLIGEICRLASAVTEAVPIKLRRAKGPDLRLVCDPDLIEQAVLNLITNAIPIVGRGEEIVLSAHANKGDAIIRIFHPRARLLGHVRVPMAVMPGGELLGVRVGSTDPQVGSRELSDRG